MKPKNQAISLKSDVYEIIKTIQSCYQLVYKESLSANDIIKKYILSGVKATDSKIDKMLEVVLGMEYPQNIIDDSEQEDNRA